MQSDDFEFPPKMTSVQAAESITRLEINAAILDKITKVILSEQLSVHVLSVINALKTDIQSDIAGLKTYLTDGTA